MPLSPNGQGRTVMALNVPTTAQLGDYSAMVLQSILTIHLISGALFSKLAFGNEKEGCYE